MRHEDSDPVPHRLEAPTPSVQSRDRPHLVRVGFIPLVDSAALLVAARLGFGRREGIEIELVRQTSWAALRDRVAVGHVDCAHMLAPMPIAASLGIGGFSVPMVAPMALGLGGNAITVSSALWAAMEAEGAVIGAGPIALGKALAAVVARRSSPLTFAMVHPFSGHHYELRYWLSAAGIHPDRDVRLIVIPPPYMAEAIESGQIDGCCVGEPWNSLAVERGAGVLALANAELWRSSPCKVVGARTDYAEREPDRLAALIRAVTLAAHWCDQPGNWLELAQLLGEETLVGVDPALILRALSGNIVAIKGGTPRLNRDFLTFHDRAATFPWRSHALWFYSQMVRWNQIEASPEAECRAAATYRPDLYRAALASTSAILPTASSKLEGALVSQTTVGAAGGRLDLGPDPFFDRRIFDPDDVAGYLAGFPDQ